MTYYKHRISNCYNRPADKLPTMLFIDYQAHMSFLQFFVSNMRCKFKTINTYLYFIMATLPMSFHAYIFVIFEINN